MDDLFLLKLVLSFVVGGIWIAGITVLAEKAGSRIGGVIGGLPTMGGASVFFIAWTQSPEFASEATTILPAILGMDMVFLVAYLGLLRKGIGKALTGALAIWLITSTALVLSNPTFLLSIIVLVIASSLAYYILELKWAIPSKGRLEIKHTVPELTLRGLFAGSVVAVAVLASAIGGPLWGGMFAFFPAVFTTTMVILSLKHGFDFAAAVGKTLIFAAFINILVFILAIRHTYLWFGLIPGFLSAFALSLVAAFFSNAYAKRFMT